MESTVNINDGDGPSANHSNNVKDISVRLHRGHIFSELMHLTESGQLTEHSTLKVTTVLPNGKEEIGEDSASVARDALTEIWKEFYNRCTVRNRFRVPTIRHDMQKVQRQTIAKILCLGFCQVEYFPLYIAPPFLTCALGLNDGKSLEKDNLLTTFSKHCKIYLFLKMKSFWICFPHTSAGDM